MVQLPVELWLHVAHFIPSTMLKDLISVHRAFFYAEMAKRYKEVRLKGFFQTSDNNILQLVDSLQVPFIRDCVQILRVRPCLLQEFLPVAEQRQHQDDTTSTSTSPDTTHLHVKVKHIFSSFSNLVEYHLLWFERLFIGDSSIDILRAPMLASQHLRKLSLEASLDKLELFLSVEDVLPRLEELDVLVRRRSDVDSGAPTVLQTSEQNLPNRFASLTSFINRHRLSLRRFSLSVIEALDCTPLFLCLHQQFPLLHEFCLSVPTEVPHIGDPSTLAHWMTWQRASLHKFTMKPYLVTKSLLWEDSFEVWIETFLSHLSLPDLRILKLKFYFPAKGIQKLVRHFANTLDELDLGGHHMTFDQVAGVLKVLSPVQGAFGVIPQVASRLSVLRLGKVTLSPELIDIFAETLPGLQELDLRMEDAVPHKDEAPVYSWSGSFFRKTRNQSPAQIEQFLNAMRSRTYPDWGLQRLSVWVSLLKLQNQYQPRYVELFERCIPSLTSVSNKI
ncbi:hypothetical protein J3R30DRAFT_1095505 [Lentinula aciculospora]|uniref:F-box domain-containing protein n=1 Tax=Lentinula aciculospora TaxID=153920 RepID=A0A9W9DHZ2_9AGAR|nr:hypothetical protein J3R30DRAFT_1095505 [Lentinula aciculospora]